MALYAPDGSIRVTVVTGTTLCGAYASDGSLNVIVAPNPATAPLGAQHPCGAMYVTPAPAGVVTPLRAPDGTRYVSDKRDIVVVGGGTITVPTNYTLPTPTKLQSYDADTGFTLVGANATKALDTTAKVEGTGSMKVTGTNLAQTTGLTSSHGTWNTADLGTCVVYYDRVTDASVQSVVYQIQIGAQANQTTFSNEAQFMKGGRWLAVAQSELTAISVTSGTLQISPRIIQVTPFSAQARFDAAYAKAAGRPTVVLTFDDGYKTIINTAAPLMADRGFRGTHYVAPNLLGTTGKMVEADLGTLYSLGWDLACDSTDDTAFTSMADTATALANVNTVRSYLNTNGWTRAKNHLCWPNGSKTQALADAFAGDGFLSMRNTEPQTFYSRFGVPPGVAKSIPSRGFTNSTSISTITPYVDEAVARGSTLFFHLHDISDNPSSIGWQTSNFILLLDYLKNLVNQNRLDVLTVSQWWARDGAATPP